MGRPQWLAGITRGARSKAPGSHEGKTRGPLRNRANGSAAAYSSLGESVMPGLPCGFFRFFSHGGRFGCGMGLTFLPFSNTLG